MLAVSERGDLFGWGNSEYGQLSAITDQTQVSVPRNLPLPHSISKAAAAGSKCAVLTGIRHLSLPEVKAVQPSILFHRQSLFFTYYPFLKLFKVLGEQKKYFNQICTCI